MAKIKTWIKPIIRDDEALTRTAGNFVKEHSWGVDFPLDAVDFLRRTSVAFGAFTAQGAIPGMQLVGTACITRYRGCPDYPDDTHPWFCCWVVHPDYRDQGIGGKLYQETMSYAQSQRGALGGVIYASTDTERSSRTLIRAPRRFLDPKWRYVRDGNNEDGTGMKVWALHL